jgi:hypothetical protein
MPILDRCHRVTIIPESPCDAENLRLTPDCLCDALPV